MRGLTVPDRGCAGAERLCGAALRSAGREGLEVMWQEAESALLAGLTLEEAPALETFARMPWPLTELLAAASRKGHGAAQQAQATPGRGGICACDLSLWPVEEARSVAAAQKVLEEINGGPKTLDALSQALESPSAKTACGAAWGGRLATAEQLLSELWGLHPDLPIEESLPLAASLRDSGWAFDPGVCLVGVASLGLVCSTRQLLSGDFSKGTEAAHATYVCLSALLGCVDLGQILPPPSYGSLPDWQALRMDFVEDWPELAIWIPDPLRFFFQVQGPVLRSSRWLHGSDASARVASLLSSRQRGKTASAATACSGVWNLTAEHRCWSMQGSRKDSKPVEVAQTRILGTGLMKAGTTVIWQCLAAAGNFSMGLDCDGLAEAPIVHFTVRREVPLEHLVDLCFDELFSWEISKDVLLTPVARRLAHAWSALSHHGQRLQLYFVVRNPFDFASSLLSHMSLDTFVTSEEEQIFSWVAGRLPKHFSRGKQQYLDVALSGLRYSGYVDAVVQRWVLVVDEYLQCPQDFVLVRYEDFSSDPVQETRNLLHELGFAHLWGQGAEERVRQVAEVQYQTKGQHGRNPEEVFGPRMLARVVVAVQTRAELLGYGSLLPAVKAVPEDWPAIDVPPTPVVGSAC